MIDEILNTCKDLFSNPDHQKAFICGMIVAFIFTIKEVMDYIKRK